MANRIRAIDEKVKPVSLALSRINIEAVAHEAGVPASTLSYDLSKVGNALPEVLSNRTPGPKPQKKLAEEAKEASLSEERPAACPKCRGKVTKNGTYWVLSWLLMLTMGWLGVQRVLIQRWRCKECGHELVSPEQARQAAARRAWWSQVVLVLRLMDADRPSPIVTEIGCCCQ